MSIWAFNPILRELGLEQLVNRRVLLLVAELIAVFGHAGVDVTATAVLRLLTALADGQRQHGILTSVEMLVEPHLRWDEHDSGLPVDALDGRTGEPEQGVPGAGEEQRLNACLVAIARSVA